MADIGILERQASIIPKDTVEIMLTKRGISPEDTKSTLESGNNDKNAVFARELLHENFFSEDTSTWQKLHRLYRQNKKALPASVPLRLALEAFYKAKEVQSQPNAARNEGNLFNIYTNAMERAYGESVDPTLIQEQRFISNELQKSVTKAVSKFIKKSEKPKGNKPDEQLDEIERANSFLKENGEGWED